MVPPKMTDIHGSQKVDRTLFFFFFQAEAVLATAGSFRNDGANGTLPVLNPAELHQLQVQGGGGRGKGGRGGGLRSTSNQELRS